MLKSQIDFTGFLSFLRNASIHMCINFICAQKRRGFKGRYVLLTLTEAVTICLQ